MNPYLRIQFKIPKLTYLYINGFLDGSWPETEPDSLEPPKEIIAKIMTTNSFYTGEPSTICTIQIWLDGEMVPEPLEGIKWFRGKEGKLDFFSTSFHGGESGIPFPREEISTLKNPHLLNFFERFQTTIDKVYKEWTPEPTAEQILKALFIVGRYQIFNPNNAIGETVDAIYIAYGIYKEKPVYVVSTLPNIFRTPKQVVEAAYDNWLKLKTIEKPDDPFPTRQEKQYVKTAIKDLKEKMERLREILQLQKEMEEES